MWSVLCSVVLAQPFNLLGSFIRIGNKKVMRRWGIGTGYRDKILFMESVFLYHYSCLFLFSDTPLAVWLFPSYSSASCNQIIMIRHVSIFLISWKLVFGFIFTYSYVISCSPANYPCICYIMYRHSNIPRHIHGLPPGTVQLEYIFFLTFAQKTRSAL